MADPLPVRLIHIYGRQLSGHVVAETHVLTAGWTAACEQLTCHYYSSRYSATMNGMAHVLKLRSKTFWQHSPLVQTIQSGRISENLVRAQSPFMSPAWLRSH